MGMSEGKYNTMRRMKNGSEYSLRGDRVVGIEVIKGSRYDNGKVINCRSLPPLIREGLIDFERYPRDITRYYRVKLTDKGEMALLEGGYFMHLICIGRGLNCHRP